MAAYQRFQVLSAARQNLFLPDSPVWVSRYQLSRDQESGKRLLQTRMVNCAEKDIQQVFLRVVCFDERRERLTQLELVPIETPRAKPGEVFGDDKLVELSVRGAVFAEVYAQRVRFTDGSAWDETDPHRYLAFPSPEPVRPEDAHYELLAERALSGGVQNAFYFRSQQGLWLCTCGLPNASRTRRCVRCGADRLWLEQHMDRNLLDTPPRAPEHAPAPPVMPFPAPMREDPYPPMQPTIILQPAPEPAAETGEAAVPERSRRAGRIAVIAAASALTLGLAAFCTVQFLLPYLHYRQALREQASGDYDHAVELFRELGDYKDSVEQIEETLAQKALRMMNEGSYQQAMDLLDSLEGYDDYKADCLYALGVLAYNDKDPDRAMTYVNKLDERYPNYEKTAELRRYCLYSLGNREAAAAADAADPDTKLAHYQKAISWLEQVGDYEDNAERLAECRYRIAGILRDKGELLEAIEAFAALGEYKDAASYRRECMMSYAREHVEKTDDTTMQFLTELANEGMSEAQHLLDRINGKGFSFRVTLGPADNTGRLKAVSDLSQVYIHYQVEQSDENGAVLVLVLYTLPDGREGRALLNNDHSTAGVRGWAEFPFPTNCAQQGSVTLTFYDSMRGEEVEPLEQVAFELIPNGSAPRRDSVPNKDDVPNKDETPNPGDISNSGGDTGVDIVLPGN